MNLSREQFIEDRRKGFGGTDIAPILHLSPYKTAYEVWLEKTGQSIEYEDTERMKAGRALENAVAVLATDKYGYELRKKHVAVACPEEPRLRGNADYVIVGKRTGLECKLVDGMVYRFDDQWGEPDTANVPVPYLLQCMTYIACFGYDQWHLVALVGGNTVVRYVIPRDDEMIAMIITAVRDFSRYVETRTPPPLNYENPACVPLLRRLYPGTNGERKAMPAVFNALAESYQYFTGVAKGAEQAKDAIVAQVLDFMGSASVGVLENGDGEWVRKVVSRKAYEVKATTFTTCRFSSKLKKESNDE